MFYTPACSILWNALHRPNAGHLPEQAPRMLGEAPASGRSAAHVARDGEGGELVKAKRCRTVVERESQATGRQPGPVQHWRQRLPAGRVGGVWARTGAGEVGWDTRRIRPHRPGDGRT